MSKLGNGLSIIIALGERWRLCYSYVSLQEKRLLRVLPGTKQAIQRKAGHVSFVFTKQENMSVCFFSMLSLY